MQTKHSKNIYFTKYILYKQPDADTDTAKTFILLHMYNVCISRQMLTQTQHKHLFYYIRVYKQKDAD